MFFPNEPIPVKVLAAGGTKEMGSLAGPGKALREVLGAKVVLALATRGSSSTSPRSLSLFYSHGVLGCLSIPDTAKWFCPSRRRLPTRP